MKTEPAPSWEAIRRASQKPAGYLYTRYVNRHGARYLTFLAARAGASPNALSIISALLTVAAAALMLSVGARPSWALASYACLALGYFFDSADGQLARATGRLSTAGGFLDHSLDGAKTPLAMTTVGYAYHLHAAEELVLLGTAWPGIVLVAAASWAFTITWQKDAIVKTRDSWITPSLSLAYLSRTPFDYGVVLLWIPALVLAPAPATVGLQILAPAYVAFALGMCIRGYRLIDQGAERD